MLIGDARGAAEHGLETLANFYDARNERDTCAAHLHNPNPTTGVPYGCANGERMLINLGTLQNP